jgi:hypothetical protein
LVAPKNRRPFALSSPSQHLNGRFHQFNTLQGRRAGPIRIQLPLQIFQQLTRTEGNGRFV